MGPFTTLELESGVRNILTIVRDIGDSSLSEHDSHRMEAAKELANVLDKLTKTQALETVIVSAMSTLNKLATDAEDYRVKLECRRDILQRHIGMMRLPNEILSHIFTLGFRSSGAAIRDSLAISHVSPWFRAVALSTPELWCNIIIDLSNHLEHVWSDSESNIPDYILRSKTFPLAIQVIYGMPDVMTSMPVENSIKAFMPLLVSHIHRWRTFKVRTTDMTHMDTILWQCKDASAPALEDLSLEFCGYILDFAKPNIPLDVFSCGARLRSISCTQGILNLLHFKSLTSLAVQRDVCGARNDPNGAYSIGRLLRLLESLPDVTTLKYSFSKHFSELEALTGVVDLRGLKCLILEGEGFDSGWSIIYFLDHVSTPSLEELSITVSTMRSDPGELQHRSSKRLLMAIKKRHHTYARLHSFMLSYPSDDYDSLCDVFVGMTALVNVTIKGHFLFTPFPLDAKFRNKSPFKMLQSITLEQCAVSKGELYKFTKWRAEHPTLGPLRRMVLTECTDISDEELELIGPLIEERLIWTPCQTCK